MALPKLPLDVFSASRQLLSGNWANAISNLLTTTTGSTPITALAGGGLSAATPVLNNAFNELGVVANANDSVVLPLAKAGLKIGVINSGNQSAQIFANGTDTINGTAGNVGVALASGATAIYVCFRDGIWKRFVSA